MLRRFGRRRRDDQLASGCFIAFTILAPCSSAFRRSEWGEQSLPASRLIQFRTLEPEPSSIFDRRSSIASPPRLHSFPALLECLSANRLGVLIWQCKFAWERP